MFNRLTLMFQIQLVYKDQQHTEIQDLRNCDGLPKYSTLKCLRLILSILESYRVVG